MCADTKRAHLGERGLPTKARVPQTQFYIGKLEITKNTGIFVFYLLECVEREREEKREVRKKTGTEEQKEGRRG